MDPINVYFTPKSLRIAAGEKDAASLINYIFHALDNMKINQVLRVRLSDIDIITYPCLMYVIRRLAQEITKGGKYYNKFMVIEDLPRDSSYRKEMMETIKAVIDNIELPILLIADATSNNKDEYEILGSIFYSTPYLEALYKTIREEEKKGSNLITAVFLAKKMNQPKEKISIMLRRLSSFRLLIREHVISSGKSRGEYCYSTILSRVG